MARHAQGKPPDPRFGAGRCMVYESLEMDELNIFQKSFSFSEIYFREKMDEQAFWQETLLKLVVQRKNG